MAAGKGRIILVELQNTWDTRLNIDNFNLHQQGLLRLDAILYYTRLTPRTYIFTCRICLYHQPISFSCPFFRVFPGPKSNGGQKGCDGLLLQSLIQSRHVSERAGA